MNKWQPIETIPKDGTRVLVGQFNPEHMKYGRIVVDWWRRPDDGAGFIGLGLFSTPYWPATHWMPLPKPPIDAIPQDEIDRIDAILAKVADGGER